MGTDCGGIFYISFLCCDSISDHTCARKRQGRSGEKSDVVMYCSRELEYYGASCHAESLRRHLPIERRSEMHGQVYGFRVIVHNCNIAFDSKSTPSGNLKPQDL